MRSAARSGWRTAGFPDRRGWSVLLALSLAATLACVTAAHAGPMVWGFSGGVDGARLHGGYGDDFGDEYHAGGAVGVSVRFELQSWLSLQPEMWWIQKGGEGDVTFIISSGLSTEILTGRVVQSTPYLEWPVLLRLGLPGSGAVEPFVLAGPAFAVRAGGTRDVEADGVALLASSPRIQPASIFEGVRVSSHLGARDWDFGLIGGAGVTLGRGRVRANLEVRYERDLVNLFPNSVIGGATNGVVSGLAGVEFR